jgi:hypothetical protein
VPNSVTAPMLARRSAAEEEDSERHQRIPAAPSEAVPTHRGVLARTLPAAMLTSPNNHPG